MLATIATLIVVGVAYVSPAQAQAQAQAEQQIKTEIQKKLGSNAKVRSVTPSPVSGVYEVLVSNEVFIPMAQPNI